MIVACTPDLADRSKVASLGEVTFVRRGVELLERTAPGDLVVVDLVRAGDVDIATLVSEGRRVVAFTNHAEETALSIARGAGAVALARSVFFRRLSEGTLLDGDHDG